MARLTAKTKSSSEMGYKHNVVMLALEKSSEKIAWTVITALAAITGFLIFFQ